MRKSLSHAMPSALFAALVCCFAISCAIDHPEVNHFKRQMYYEFGKRHVLNVTASPKVGGEVARSPAARSNVYGYGDEITMVARPAEGYKFTSWSGSFNATTDTVTVTMNQDFTLTANFISMNDPQYFLNVGVYPGQGGTVTNNLKKLVYSEGDTVVLKAEARQNYKFIGWSGALNDTSESVTVAMTGDMELTANFIEEHLNAYALRIKVEPDDAGTVTRKPDRGIYYAGESWVNVTAVPKEGYVFDSWSESEADSTNSLRILMNGDKTLTAVFKEEQ